jgi:DnaK suppressor protein
MGTDFIQKMQLQLEEEKKRIEKELSQFAHRNSNTTIAEFETNFPNMGDKEDENASEVAQFSDNLSLEDELEKGLRDIESALELIKKGTYGTCKYCGQKIDERRLIARPTSSSCIQCKKTLTQEV